MKNNTKKYNATAMAPAIMTSFIGKYSFKEQVFPCSSPSHWEARKAFLD